MCVCLKKMHISRYNQALLKTINLSVSIWGIKQWSIAVFLSCVSLFIIQLDLVCGQLNWFQGSETSGRCLDIYRVIVSQLLRHSYDMHGVVLQHKISTTMDRWHILWNFMTIFYFPYLALMVVGLTHESVEKAKKVDWFGAVPWCFPGWLNWWHVCFTTTCTLLPLLYWLSWRLLCTTTCTLSSTFIYSYNKQSSTLSWFSKYIHTHRTRNRALIKIHVLKSKKRRPGTRYWWAFRLIINNNIIIGLG